MNIKIVYVVVGVIVISLSVYFFLNTNLDNQQLPINNSNTSEPVVSDSVVNESDDTKLEDLQNQIEDLQDQINDQNNQEETTFPDEEISKEHKTYTNNSFGISFNYPESYILEVKGGSSLAELHIALEDGATSGTSSINIMVNPAGFGPIWANIRYYLSYDNGELGIVNKVTQPCEYCDTEGIDSILGSIETGKDNYFFNSSWPRSGKSREQDTLDIIESFNF